MKRLMTTTCAAAALGLTMAFAAPPAIAADDAPPPPKQPGVIESIAIGTIGDVDLPNSAFVLRQADGKMVNVTFNAETKITLNGEESDKASIKAGERAIVNHVNGAASLIEIRG